MRALELEPKALIGALALPLIIHNLCPSLHHLGLCYFTSNMEMIKSIYPVGILSSYWMGWEAEPASCKAAAGVKPAVEAELQWAVYPSPMRPSSGPPPMLSRRGATIPLRSWRWLPLWEQHWITAPAPRPGSCCPGHWQQVREPCCHLGMGQELRSYLTFSFYVVLVPYSGTDRDLKTKGLWGLLV